MEVIIMKKVIWSSEINLADWEDYLKEEYPDVTDESEQYDLVFRLNNEYLYDERANLHSNANGRILVIADLGLWDGRCKGYKILSDNIADILYSSCDDAEWYSDGKNIRAIGRHHDGTNHYLYRVIKENRNIDALLTALRKGTMSNHQIGYYTESLHPYVAKIYGW
jgi:hypothetical protein